MKRNLWSIQYLRAMAALSLVVFHALLRTEYPNDVFRVGTDIFFVTSGFLVWSISAEKKLNPLEFIVRRVTRLLPLYWLLTALTFLAATARPGLYWMVDTNPVHLVKSLLFTPDYDRDGALYPVIVQAWMLNSLVFLYFIFSLTLVLPRALRLWAFTLVLGALVITGACITIRSAPVEAYTSPILLEFLGGVWLGEFNLREPQHSKTLGIAVIAAAALTFAAGRLLPHALVWRPLSYGVPSLLLLAGIVALEQSGTLSKLARLKLLGDASYSIYVSHMLVVDLIARLLAGATIAVRMAVTLGVASCVGIALYRCVEAPIDARMRGLTARVFPTRRRDTLVRSN